MKITKKYDLNVMLIICDKQNRFCLTYESCNSKEIIHQLSTTKFGKFERYTNEDVYYIQILIEQYEAVTNNLKPNNLVTRFKHPTKRQKILKTEKSLNIIEENKGDYRETISGPTSDRSHETYSASYARITVEDSPLNSDKILNDLKLKINESKEELKEKSSCKVNDKVKEKIRSKSGNIQILIPQDKNFSVCTPTKLCIPDIHQTNMDIQIPEIKWNTFLNSPSNSTLNSSGNSYGRPECLMQTLSDYRTNQTSIRQPESPVPTPVLNSAKFIRSMNIQL